MQAINALNRTDVFFLMDKGSVKDSLIGLRKTICERFIQGRDYRFISADCPERVRDVPDYRGSVAYLNVEVVGELESVDFGDIAPDYSNEREDEWEGGPESS